MKFFKTFLLLVFLLMVCYPGYAEEIRMVGAEVPGLIDAKGNGPYNKLIEAIVADSGVNIKLTIKSIASTFAEYNEGKYDSVFPATTEIVEKSSIESVPFNRVKVFLFTAPGTTPVKSLDEVKDKRVGRIAGMDYPKIIINAPVKVELAANEVVNIQNLLDGSIDAFFGIVPDVYLAIEELGGNIHLSVDKSIAYMDIKDCFVFLDKPEHKPIINKLNESIKKLRENGELQELLGIAFVD